ncbi:MAG: protein phosphatase 2C domain-containing protein [Candidatus Eisenbacteria bacterium]|uniref:Protein phosphatase 2C domain-containing protein n=1 Tax=Eiseniibacteriota bacterium TaxID=2212470 RepID=A0A956RM96_UNCEI|nr:protein phosphatase 2C domain-containing protein [Candidatus Eisenbacteria bacterium]
MDEIFLEAAMESVEVREFLAGTVAVFSTPSPGKTSPNEDVAALFAYEPAGGVLVICDGVGGSPLGRHASRVAVEEVRAHLEVAASGQQSLREAILNGIESANRSVLDLGQGAATTIAIAEIQADSVRPYHAGDSVVLVTGQRGRLRLQTIAHSPVGYAVESGMLDQDEAVHHEERHLVSNVVGAQEMRIEVGPGIDLRARDTVLVASDGLFDNFYVEEIVRLVRTGPLEQVAAALAHRCLERMRVAEGDRPGKPDDLSFILYRPTRSSASRRISAASSGRKHSSA